METYTPSWLQTPRLKRLAEIVSAQAVMQQQLDASGKIEEEGVDWHVNGHANGHTNGHLATHELTYDDDLSPGS